MQSDLDDDQYLEAAVEHLVDEIAKRIDKDIVDSIIKEAKKSISDSYDRAMKGL